MVNHQLDYLFGRLLVRFFGLKRFSYSSLNEDNIIDWLTGYKAKGTYIDIGAYDPNLGNNTRLFYERGWRGINIEPTKENYKKFLQQRPKDINLDWAIGEGEMEFYCGKESSGNTFVKKTAENRKIIQKKVIKLVPLSEVFRKYHLSKVDFMTIDVETFEHEVLKSNDWRKYKADVICLEGKDYPELKKVGYKLVFWDGSNSYFKLKD